MAAPLITLERVVYDIASKADYLVASYFYSHNKQSDITPELVLSLPERMALMANDPNGFSQQIEADMTSLLEGYFDAVRVTVTLDSNDTSYKINLSVNVIEDDRAYDLATLIRAEGKLVKDIARVTSEGKLIPFKTR